MFTTYILESLKNGKYYIGHASDLEKRLARHNARGSRWTKSGIPWRIVFAKDFPSKGDAMRFELQLKRIKNRRQIEMTYIAGWRSGISQGS